MGCPYAYYKDETEYFARLYCKCNNEWCIYTKRCNNVKKFIQIDDEMWKGCCTMLEQKSKNIPIGSNYIQSTRPNRNGKLYLYVIINNKVERILSNFTEMSQDYVYVKEGLDGYVVSLTPFTEPKKSTNNTKKTKNAK